MKTFQTNVGKFFDILKQEEQGHRRVLAYFVQNENGLIDCYLVERNVPYSHLIDERDLLVALGKERIVTKKAIENLDFFELDAIIDIYMQKYSVSGTCYHGRFIGLEPTLASGYECQLQCDGRLLTWKQKKKIFRSQTEISRCISAKEQNEAKAYVVSKKAISYKEYSAKIQTTEEPSNTNEIYINV